MVFQDHNNLLYSYNTKNVLVRSLIKKQNVQKISFLTHANHIKTFFKYCTLHISLLWISFSKWSHWTWKYSFSLIVQLWYSQKNRKNWPFIINRYFVLNSGCWQLNYQSVVIGKMYPCKSRKRLISSRFLCILDLVQPCIRA